MLVHAAAGGVGIAATQIAKRYGAQVHGTASASKHGRIRELGVPQPADTEQHGRVHDRPSDAVGVHVGETSLRVVRRRPHLGVAKLAPLRPLALLERHPRRPGQRQPVGRQPLAVVDAPLRAVRVGLDVPDAIGEIPRRVLQHPVRVLEHVPVRVDEVQRRGRGHRIPLVRAD